MLHKGWVVNTSASTVDVSVVMTSGPGKGAKEAAVTLVDGLDLPPPSKTITITDRNLEDSYIDKLMRSKGLEEPQIAKIKASIRQYIDSFIDGKDIDLDDGAYALLTNMIIHLIEESSQDE